MMALEEKFEITLDEEGEPVLPALQQMVQATAVWAAPHAPPARPRPCRPRPHATPGAEKISTVQEAADLIAAQVASK
jgi:acyl carrier protein